MWGGLFLPCIGQKNAKDFEFCSFLISHLVDGLFTCDCVVCVFSSFHWVLSAGGQAELDDGLESPHLLGYYNVLIHSSSKCSLDALCLHLQFILNVSE